MPRGDMLSVYSARGQKDPDVLDLVRDRKTESSTLSTNGQAMTLQLIASCRFVLTIGDVRSLLLLADREESPKGHRPTSKGRMHPDQLFEVRGGCGLGDQPQRWWRAFENFFAKKLGSSSIRWILVLSCQRALE